MMKFIGIICVVCGVAYGAQWLQAWEKVSEKQDWFTPDFKKINIALETCRTNQENFPKACSYNRAARETIIAAFVTCDAHHDQPACWRIIRTVKDQRDQFEQLLRHSPKVFPYPIELDSLLSPDNDWIQATWSLKDCFKALGKLLARNKLNVFLCAFGLLALGVAWYSVFRWRAKKHEHAIEQKRLFDLEALRKQEAAEEVNRSNALRERSERIRREAAAAEARAEKARVEAEQSAQRAATIAARKLEHQKAAAAEEQAIVEKQRVEGEEVTKVISAALALRKQRRR